MAKIKKEQIQRHIRTHTERSDDDRNAVAILNAFLRSGGKIAYSSFACNGQQLETTQRCPPGGEKRYFLYSGVLLSNKNELTTDTPTTWMHLGNIMLRKRI